MGHKTHPLGFRLGIIKQWNAKWFANSLQYKGLVKEDLTMRTAIQPQN